MSPEETAFFDELWVEFKNVNDFYNLKEHFFLERVNGMISHINNVQLENSAKDANSYFKFHLKYTKQAERAALSTAFRELYRGLDLLKNYRVLNYTAFVKILKKYKFRLFLNNILGMTKIRFFLFPILFCLI